ncbi:MAG TPA: bifunctional 5,10-methylenetetrahydrofolate dehydrogenase/5,10-methenyltetrahydrofolate cyclohydrolase [Bryobacteraceae bacterium]|nr:bifunctional 5,10-methylenetetrahydrofolate dehydrogenase/5,10-methenyltetrahydrofolate cyclohydrolase [Bryobacteraceae bacterium]
MQILDGTLVRAEILSRLKPRIARLKRPPGLAVVLVGHDPASEIYVRGKIKACGELGIYSEKLTPPESISTEELLAVIDDLNQRPEIDGILVQMPLPKQVDSRRVLESVAPDKDADGFHPVNVGHLVAGRPAPRACTPAGIIQMLKFYGCPIDGRRAVIVGRSDIVGKPMALMLLHESATVTICHSRTLNLAGECRRAEILVAAVGRPGFVTRDFIAPGAVVIDVGQNRIDDRALAETLGKGDEFARKGSALVGDVNPIDAIDCASAYTPVPRGVGPLTIAMLMANTVELAEKHQSAANTRE